MKNITDPAFMQAFEKRQLRPIDAVPTHLASVNRFCHDDGGGIGLARGWTVTVGGNPGFGKSTFALNLSSAALQAGEAVGYVSLEMTVGQLAARFYAIHTGEEITRLEKGSFDVMALNRVRDHLNGLPELYVPERITGRWQEIVDFVHECHQAGVRWFVLDYLQLVQIGDEEKIHRALIEIATDLRTWAANTGSTLVVLSQFNRETSSNYTDRPRCQGLYGGMILEASSDLVILLDHSRYERDGDVARTYVIVDKNRHGRVGQVPVLWDYRNLRMREAMDDELREWPGQE